MVRHLQFEIEDTSFISSIGANVAATAKSLSVTSKVLSAATALPSLTGVGYSLDNIAKTNSAHGYSSLNNGLGITGLKNSAGGYGAGQSVSTGNDNTLYGNSAGAIISTGSQNTAFGSGATFTANNSANRGAFGFNASSTANNKMTFTSSYTALSASGANTVTFGTSFPTTASAANLFYNTADGILYRSTSSKTQKKNISSIISVDTSKIFQMEAAEYEENCEGDIYLEPGSVEGCDYCSLKVGKDEGIDIEKLNRYFVLTGTCPDHKGKELGKRKIGFIAEDFQKNDLGLVTIKDETDNIIDYDLKCLVGVLFSEIKKMKIKLDSL